MYYCKVYIFLPLRSLLFTPIKQSKTKQTYRYSGDSKHKCRIPIFSHQKTPDEFLSSLKLDIKMSVKKKEPPTHPLWIITPRYRAGAIVHTENKRKFRVVVASAPKFAHVYTIVYTYTSIRCHIVDLKWSQNFSRDA